MKRKGKKILRTVIEFVLRYLEDSSPFQKKPLVSSIDDPWYLFVLAVIQTRTGGIKEERAVVPYRYVKKQAISYGAPHTSAQKIKEAFDYLCERSFIERHRKGNKVKYEQKVFLTDVLGDLHIFREGVRGSGG